MVSHRFNFNAQAESMSVRNVTHGDAQTLSICGGGGPQLNTTPSSSAHVFPSALAQPKLTPVTCSGNVMSIENGRCFGNPLTKGGFAS